MDIPQRLHLVFSAADVDFILGIPIDIASGPDLWIWTLKATVKSVLTCTSPPLPRWIALCAMDCATDLKRVKFIRSSTAGLSAPYGSCCWDLTNPDSPLLGSYFNEYQRNKN
ncbi:hypothetical protein TorRG33x02_211650 [Trema orientale]|uniref:Uncharacterized protein n=1 Tax=Trema orientale TaxID=63057 RepID=A0A2P5EC03_TREOI|nr:hypothetical protein TorRG33x02_211650 [Trema orientale]